MTTVRRWQLALVALGLILLSIGGVVLLNDVNPRRYLGIATWFAGALVVHDGIIALVVFATNIAMRKTGARFAVPLPVLLIVQGALVIAGVMSLIVVPAALKRSIGTANPTLLPLDYGLHLVVFYVVLAAASGLAVLGWAVRVRVRASRRRAKEPERP